MADNRTTATGIIERFSARGFDVVAYDSRAHGESDGDACTYGFLEKQDLRRVLDYRRRGESIGDLSGSRPRGLVESAGQFRVLLKEVQGRLGSKPNETILGGFSQGALIASDIAFRTDDPLRALVILSGTFVDDIAWTKGMSRRKGRPVFIAHGRGDTALKFDVATRLEESMRRAGMQVTWVPFDGGHEMPSAVVTALNGFLVQIGAGETNEDRVPGVLPAVTPRK